MGNKTLKEQGKVGIQIQIPEDQHKSLIQFKRAKNWSLSKAISSWLDVEKINAETKKQLLENLKELDINE